MKSIDQNKKENIESTNEVSSSYTYKQIQLHQQLYFYA